MSKIGPSIRGRPRNPATWLALSIPVLMTVAALFHSVQDSLYPLFLALGASALALVIWDMSRDDMRRYVVYPLLTAASIQAVVAIIQLATSDDVHQDSPGHRGDAENYQRLPGTRWCRNQR